MGQHRDRASKAQIALIFELLEYLVSRVALAERPARPIVFELLTSSPEVWSFDPRRRSSRLFQRGKVEGAHLRIRGEPGILLRVLLEPDFSLDSNDGLYFVGDLECLDHLTAALERGCDLLSRQIAHGAG